MDWTDGKMNFPFYHFAATLRMRNI